MMIASIARTRHLLAGILLLLVGIAPAAAQDDIAVTALLQPSSGCELASTENVTVRIFNYGASLPAATTFIAAYRINSGPFVTEQVVLAAPLLSNSAFSYTFTSQANLTAPGAFTIDATVSLGSDVTPTNNAFNGTAITNSAAPVAGTVTGPPPGPNGTLTLSGQTGAVAQWEESPDSLRWFKLANTTTTQAYSGITTPTRFRVRVANGSCPPALSSVFVVNP